MNPKFLTGLATILVGLCALASLRADNVQKKNSDEKLVTRTYQVGSWFFADNPELASAKDDRTHDVKSILSQRGIRFPPGSSATYTPSTGRLVFVNDADQIELLQESVNFDTDKGSHGLEPIESKP